MKGKKILSHITAALGGAAAMALVLASLLLWRCGSWESFRQTMKYGTVLGLAEKYYVGDFDAGAVTDAALEGAVEALGDRWSYYMDTDTYAAYRDYSHNQYQGIGVTVIKDGESGGFLITELTKDGPAVRAGIRPGEIILACNGEDVTGGNATELRAMIQASFGENLTLTLQAEDGSCREVELSCEVVDDPPVHWELLEGSVGYILIDNFEDGSGAMAIEAIEDLRQQGAQSLLFDVRNNPGGQVAEMCELLDSLLPEGEIFVREDKKGSRSVITSDEQWLDMPAAVLLNAESYSAAEYFAAVLKEYGRAAVVGQSSTGKGRSQLTFGLTDGSALHMSVYRYMTPAGVDLSQVGGLDPERMVRLTSAQEILLGAGLLEPEDDPQLQAALELLLAEGN